MQNSNATNITTETRKFAVFGNPVAHSLSPQIHSMFAKQFGIDLSYKSIKSTSEDLKSILLNFLTPTGGANITAPFKEIASVIVDKLTPEAQQAMAVNTIFFDPTDNSILCGGNTDGTGFIRDITVNLGVQLKHKSILILGAGGSVRGLLGKLLKEQPKTIVIANRTLDRAQQLATLYHQPSCLKTLTIEALQTWQDEPFDIFINARTANMFAGIKPELDVPNHCLTRRTIAYDLNYNLATEPYRAWFDKNHSIQMIDGLGMLVEQAAEAFFIWHEKRPNTKPVIETIGATESLQIRTYIKSANEFKTTNLDYL